MRTFLTSIAVVSFALVAMPSGGEPGTREEGAKRPAVAPADAKDWPTYNADVLGTRHNVGEKVLSRDNAAKLVEKWRFPAADSKQTIGAVHATPAVVDGGCISARGRFRRSASSAPTAR